MPDDFDDEELEGELCPFCAEPNHPPSDTRCIHNVAWTWDGQTEALGSATQLAEAWAALCKASLHAKYASYSQSRDPDLCVLIDDRL